MKLMVIGDTHGNISDIAGALNYAGSQNIKHALVVGDFGLWTHFADGQEFLDDVNEYAVANDLSVYAIGGNHENWDHWDWFCENLPSHKGFAMVRRRVLLAPKAHQWKWHNKTFVGAGGAVSVDKEWRRLRETGRFDESGNRFSGPPTGDRTLWWPNEQLTDWHVNKIKSFGQADYLMTHDCSEYTPWQNRIKPDLDSKAHRQKIDEVLKSVQPKFHFHGHMHEDYDWVNGYSGGGARTIGLRAFGERNSWGVLDLEDDSWAWGGDLLPGRDPKVPDNFFDIEEYEEF